ncbi:YqiJ family protein [Peristeroidobacter agariperforans]|uniref:YqiJ family protein n=1 Tax=Peristeroidobacter agariperforans TaxID=268404 RepID=UPI0013004C13|nr:YqiJ family protein [Peristeroidobacter agariperforans]
MLFAPETWPFTVATFLLLLIAIVEGIAMVLGSSLSQSLQHLLPEPGDVHVGVFDKLLGWLSFGRVPALVLVVLFLASFALTGFGLNLVVRQMFGFWAPPSIAAIVAFLITLPVVRFAGAGLARVIPQDQTYAVSFDSLVGRVATIVNGTARPGYPAQAKVANEHGQMLYVMVEPEAEGMTFQSGERVLLNKRLSGNRFAGAVNPWPDLI